MSDFTDRLEAILQITVRRYSWKWLASSEILCVTGFGWTKEEAKYDLISKAILSNTQRPKVAKAINSPTEEANVNFIYQFDGNHCIITVMDEEGREKSVRMKIKK